MVHVVRPKDPQYKRVGHLGGLQSSQSPQFLLRRMVGPQYATALQRSHAKLLLVLQCDILHVLKAKFGIELKREAEAGYYNSAVLKVSLGNLEVEDLQALTDRYEPYVSYSFALLTFPSFV
jgi:hypothetical protein